MRIFMLSLGTRGDVELFVMLGRALARRGHAVVLGTSGFYAERVQAAGLDWVRIGPGTHVQLLGILGSLAAIPGKRERVLAYAQRWLRPQLAAAMSVIQATAARSDYFINNLKIVLQRSGSTMPGASITYDPPGKVEDLAKYATQKPEHRGRILEIVAMSQALIDPEGCWGPQYRFTGFWEGEPEPWTPPPELQAFLRTGPPPVVVTMGSMVTFDHDRFIGDLTAALRRAGQRAVLIGGWSGISAGRVFPETVYAADEVPYAWLFPQAGAVLHHGGCGTVAAVLRAGKPSILFPRITSQEHFGRLLARQDLVAGVFDVDALAVEELASAIRRAIGDAALRNAARRWQQHVAQEPGVEGAADLIEAHWAALNSETKVAGGEMA